MIRRRPRGHPGRDRPDEQAGAPRVSGPPGDWARTAAGGGPDLVFRARCATGTEGRLDQLLRATPLTGFRLDDLTPHGSPRGVSYVDESTYAAMEQQREQGTPSNIYIFDEIRLEGTDLVVTRGYGGREVPELARTETRLVAALALSPEIRLEHWAVRQEGYGPGSDRAFAEGDDGIELFDHIFYGP